MTRAGSVKYDIYGTWHNLKFLSASKPLPIPFVFRTSELTMTKTFTILNLVSAFSLRCVQIDSFTRCGHTSCGGNLYFTKKTCQHTSRNETKASSGWKEHYKRC